MPTDEYRLKNVHVRDEREDTGMISIVFEFDQWRCGFTLPEGARPEQVADTLERFARILPDKYQEYLDVSGGWC